MEIPTTKFDQLKIRQVVDVAKNYAEWLRKPSLVNGMWTLSDGTVVVSIPQHLVECTNYLDFDVSDKFANAYKDLVDCPQISIYLLELISLLHDEHVRETIEYHSVDCLKCEGEGEILCEACNHSHDCERCDGAGTVDGYKYEKPKLLYSTLVGFKLNGVTFLADMINKLLEISDTVGFTNSKWTVKKRGENKLLFECEGVEILAMGCRPDALEEILADI